MLEFTPTKSDHLDLALFTAQRSGRIAARAWLVWTLVLIGSAVAASLVTAVIMAVLAGTGHLATRYPGMPLGAAAVAGALVWSMTDQLRPELRERWARAWIVHSLKRATDGWPAGILTRIWTDQQGLQLLAAWQRRQIPWAHVREVAQSTDSVFIVTEDETVLLPRRADPDQVAWLAACTARMLADPSQPVEPYHPVDPEQPQTISYTLTTDDLKATQTALLEAVHGQVAQRMPSPLMTMLIIATVFTLAAVFVWQFRWEWAALIGVLAAIPATIYSRVRIRRSYRTIADRAFERFGHHQLATQGDWRQVQLDRAGLRYRTAAHEEVLALPVEIFEAPRHYVLIKDNTVIALPKRLGPEVVRFIEAVRRRSSAAPLQ